MTKCDNFFKVNLLINNKIKDLNEIYTKIDSNNQVQLLDMHGNLIDRNQKNIIDL